MKINKPLVRNIAVLVLIVAVVCFLALQFGILKMPFNVYGFSHQYTNCTEGVCSTAMYDDTIGPGINWYGDEVLLTTGVFDGTYNKDTPAPADWVQANLAPKLAELNLLMAQQGVKVGNSCKVVIEDIACNNTCVDPPACMTLHTTCQAVNNEAMGKLQAISDTSVHYVYTNDGWYIYYQPYKCVLDSVYPASLGKRYNIGIVLNKGTPAEEPVNPPVDDTPDPNPTTPESLTTKQILISVGLGILVLGAIIVLVKYRGRR